MFAHIVQVDFDHFGTMVRVIDFDAVDGNIGTHLVEQARFVEGEAARVASRVGDQCDGAAAMGGSNGLGHIRHHRDKPGFLYETQPGLPIGSMAVIMQQADVVARQALFAAIVFERFLLTRKFEAFAEQFFVDGMGIF